MGRRLEGPTIPDGGDVTKRWTVHQGDVREVLPTLEAQSFDAVLTDPPYELTSGGKTGFMGKAWDGSGVAFEVAVWAAVLAALRPGAHMLAFGGTRTFHRMTCAIEDGGFEVRDCCCYLYGSGFPKSRQEGDGRTQLRTCRSWVRPSPCSAIRPHRRSASA